MKPSTPEQLVRYLDQVSSLYPGGIPRSVLTASRVEKPSIEAAVRYQFFVVGEGPLSQSAATLLEGITSKGLRIATEDYKLSFATPDEVGSEVSKCTSEHVIVFGSGLPVGMMERVGGGPALVTHDLETLAVDSVRKKEFWRALQGVVASSR